MKSTRMLIPVFSLIVGMVPMGVKALEMESRRVTINCADTRLEASARINDTVILEKKSGDSNAPLSGVLDKREFKVIFTEDKGTREIRFALVGRTNGRELNNQKGVLKLGRPKEALASEIPWLMCDIGGMEGLAAQIKELSKVNDFFRGTDPGKPLFKSFQVGRHEQTSAPSGSRPLEGASLSEHDRGKRSGITK